MIFFIVAFLYGSMMVASQSDWESERQVKLDITISRIINAHYEPVSHMHLKSCSQIKTATRELNGGKLPIPLHAKQPIVDLLVEEFGRHHKDAARYLKKYGKAFNIYDLSIQKTLELLADQYESDSDSQESSDSSCDIEYEPAALFVSLFYDNFLPKAVEKNEDK
ncbi:hypothetical protein [Candidatus Chromulinivorax destructor]|uniref:Uncharacterized protein n=1 Tax=Candidatus Chromulinivorax destructor TaxID=2066483 RepID=A0A345ZAD7_9BACT|nr:hypothetical protein [Candidatus Chromulinivorax destructor]AXK60254.1 hypothetical protein C0J27_00615 [Candidatus Chromulinivorax destructor]